jgi:hypothetical protein
LTRVEATRVAHLQRRLGSKNRSTCELPAAAVSKGVSANRASAVGNERKPRIAGVIHGGRRRVDMALNLHLISLRCDNRDMVSSARGCSEVKGLGHDWT